ncbi:RNA polymerase sigma-70 factor, ECF subfamily [Chryseobacterium taichungense]|uniref:RNA polymerase sigma-70 factor, ECF subfamily n=1 Tax=Chryseobacterium taichungense TaxID=295069 RepID=A0A1H8DU97_9FLAO|nr:sigma-70 family RNA polymerase sigma factor [Chryseobacterium taichungense]SEN10434.1 RNA polymerase sigma-70 factor, ECF subfamily [Chryseobacterium taichungense]
MERELLLECQRNDRNAQRKVYEQMAGKLYSVCKRYLKRDEDIEEAMADTFYKIFTKIDQLHQPEIFEAWARKIAVNECLQKLRTAKHLHISFEENHVSNSDMGTEDISFEKDILSLLNFLPEGCRAIFNLFAIEGYPHKEIATMLSISEGTSKSQLNFARKKLQELLVNQNI